MNKTDKLKNNNLNPTLISPERYLPNMKSPEISYEHWHRYLSIIGIVKNKIVLDLGCGEGYGTALLSNYARDIVGVDLDKDIIKLAQKKYHKENISFLLGSASKLPIKESKVFDVVVSFEVIEHLNAKQQKNYLSEALRVLKKNGIFILSTPDKGNYSDIRKYSNPYHKKEFYREELKKLLKKYFKYITIFDQKTYPASFIWNDNKNQGVSYYNEYRLSMGEEGFSEDFNRQKFGLNMIAICSQKKMNVSINSVCLDLDEVLFKSREEEIELMRKMLKEKDQFIRSLKIHLAKYIKSGNIVNSSNKVLKLSEKIKNFF